VRQGERSTPLKPEFPDGRALAGPQPSGARESSPGEGSAGSTRDDGGRGTGNSSDHPPCPGRSTMLSINNLRSNCQRDAADCQPERHASLLFREREGRTSGLAARKLFRFFRNVDVQARGISSHPARHAHQYRQMPGVVIPPGICEVAVCGVRFHANSFCPGEKGGPVGEAEMLLSSAAWDGSALPARDMAWVRIWLERRASCAEGPKVKSLASSAAKPHLIPLDAAVADLVPHPRCHSGASFWDRKADYSARDGGRNPGTRGIPGAETTRTIASTD